MNGIIQNEYNLPLRVATYDVDADGDMRLSALLRYQQEAAERQLAAGDLGWEGLMREGMAFVTSRWHTAVTRLPRLGEDVTLCTWHRQRRGPRFFRCYEWRDAAGEVLVSGVMLFALVSVEGHRLLGGAEFDRFGLPENPTRTADCADPVHFTVPPTQPTGEYTVRRSDTDFNRHMNNTRYADLIGDFLPEEAVGVLFADVQMYFAGETLPGETLRMSAAVADGYVYVQGESPRGLSFAARLLPERDADGI